VRWWNDFFYTPCDRASDIGGLFRIAYAILMCINYALLGLDYDLFFSPTRGVMPIQYGRKTMDPDTWSLFTLIPQTDMAYWNVYYGMMLHIVLLGLGILPRFNLLAVFLWHSSFTHHNNLLWDGEDNVFRLLAFFMLFMPLDQYTIWTFLGYNHQSKESKCPMWPFRLVQIEMCLIYFSTSMLKWTGPEWKDGTALYYVIQLEDLYGGILNPPILFGYLASLKVLTWSSLLLETVAPFAIWWNKTRIPTLICIVTFHISIDVTMNLNCFHWIMILGWMSFLAQPEKT
jgi:hypothetical protein